MNELLKDLPQHAERVENNFSLKQDILEIIDIDTPVLNEIIEKFSEFVNGNYISKKDADKEFMRGYNEAQDEFENEADSINEEKLCTEYVVEKFGDCKTLEQFVETYNELRNLSYTYMR